MPPTPPPTASLTRRTAIVAASVLGLAGCRWGPADEVDGSPEPETDADKAVVDEAVRAIGGCVSLILLASDQHLGLAGVLTPLKDAHSAHLDVLVPDGTNVGASVTEGGSAQAALAAVRRRETRLQTELAELAGRATSGTLARALASMSASVAQHLATFPTLQEGPA